MLRGHHRAHRETTGWRDEDARRWWFRDEDEDDEREHINCCCGYNVCVLYYLYDCVSCASGGEVRTWCILEKQKMELPESLWVVIDFVEDRFGACWV